LKRAIAKKVLSDDIALQVPLDDAFIVELKFGECLPAPLREMELTARYACAAALAVLRRQPVEILWMRTPARD
jgi:ATP-dependent Lhr-like helicase